MMRAIRHAATGVALLAASGCATAPAPHPILAQATPAPEAAPAATPAPAGSGSSTDDQARDRRSRRSARNLGWVFVGIGATAALVAGGTSIVMLHDLSVRNGSCDANKVCAGDGSNANTQLSQLGPWNAAAYGVAALGLGVGAYLLLANKADDSAHTQTAVGVSPGGLVVRGSF